MKKYKIIYADPPWEYKSSDCIAKKSCLSKEHKEHYSYMSWENLLKLSIKDICDKNCLLFMWTTSPKLNEAIPLGEAWGFKYSTVAFVWDKKRLNPSYYTMSQIEICLVFRRGNIPKPRGLRNIRQFLSEERTIHSKKPDEIRNRITQMFPIQNKIELFARQKTEGWDVWGNEVDSSIVI